MNLAVVDNIVVFADVIWGGLLVVNQLRFHKPLFFFLRKYKQRGNNMIEIIGMYLFHIAMIVTCIVIALDDDY